jgi:meiotic recombination protein SPO11
MSKISKNDASKANKRRKETISEDLVVPEVDEVLAAVRKTRKALFDLLSATEDVPMLSNLAGVTEVEDLTTDQVSQKIEDLVVSVVTQIVTNGSFELLIPNRSSSNQRYIEELDRTVLGDKMSKRAFLNTAHVRKAAITTKVVELVHEVLSKGIHITKRDLFYTDVKLFKDQTESDAVLDDVACMVGCTRTSLHVVASDKGLVVGRIQYREAGDYIDCTKMGIGGKAIPPYVDKITDITSDADFIILVEKEAAYMRLAEDRFYNKYPCIVITGKGQPDVATRLFLRKIRSANSYICSVNLWIIPTSQNFLENMRII